MAHTPGEEIDRLLDRRIADPPAASDLPERRDRTKLPKVYLDARRRLRDRLGHSES